MNDQNKLLQEGDNYQELKSQASVGDILKMACSFEQTAFTFYSSLTHKVDQRLRPLVQELATEERGHFELFQGLGRHPHTLAHIADLIKTPPSHLRFTNYLQRPPQLAEFASDQAILLYAIGREQAAMEQYSALAEETEGPLQDLFYYLAHEEFEHQQKLQGRYEELVGV